MLLFRTFLFSLVMFSYLSPAQAESYAKYEFSFRPDVNLADGTPANDILGFSLIGRIRLRDHWLLGFSLEKSTGFDFERPYQNLAIDSIQEADASVDSTVTSAWIERRYGEKTSGGHWYWTAGVGLDRVDVDSLQGNIPGGGNFSIITEVDSGIVLTATAGRRHALGKNWMLGYGLRLEQRMGDWLLRDEVSGRSQTLDGYTVTGFFADITYRF